MWLLQDPILEQLEAPSLYSMIQCSSMGASCTFVAAMAMPKPTSSTRPPRQTEAQVLPAGWGW